MTALMGIPYWLLPPAEHRHAYDDDGWQEPCPVATCPWST